MVVPFEWDEPDSSTPFRLLKFVIDDCFLVIVAFEAANFGPGLTILGARNVELCYPLIVIPATLSGYLGDELTLATEVHLQELIFVIETSAP